jgi:hypothetical protein
MAQAAESTHYYTIDGEPMYEVPNKTKGGMRPTTLRDARKLGLRPSVSEVMKVKAKPGLERWKQRQIVESAATIPRIKNESADAFVKRVMEDAGKHAEQAAERGTRIHDAIESWAAGEDVPNDLLKYCWSAMDKMDDTFGELSWVHEKSFAHELGFGGKVDLHSRQGNLVGDWKTKEFDEGTPAAKLAYDEHVIQLAAYRVGLGMPRASVFNAFVSVTNPGLIVVKRWSEEETRRGWEMFQACFELWKLDKKYDPAEWKADDE